MIDRLALIILLAGCVALTGILASELIVTSAPETEASLGVGAIRVAQQPPSKLPEAGARPDAMVAEILARPLFSSTRRPPLHGDNPAKDSGLSDTRLTGIVTAPGHRFAIFAPTGAKPIIVSEGDTVSGWRVENITPREVSLSGPEGTKTLQPKIDTSLLPPPPPPGAAPPIRPAAVSQVRPALPPSFPNRSPLRPGFRRERQ